ASGETIYEVNEQKFGHLRAWGTTAQGIYRLGDTIQYKFYLRNQDLKTLTRAPRASYTLEILDPTSKVVEMLKDITLSEFGSYDGEFAVPKTGVVGWYQFRLTSDFAKKTNADQMEDLNANCSGESEECNISWLPMRVLVSDFTPSAFKVTNELSGDLFTSQQEIKVSTTATLHSGRAYTDASVRITAVLEALPFFSRHPLASGFLFTNESESRTSQQVFQKIDQLDNRGEASHSFTLAKPNILYGKLLVESAVQDDRGKNISTRSQAEFVGVNRFVGMRSSRWLFTAQEPASVDYIVVDERGNPVAGTNVDIKIERKVTNAARVKGAGNAYTTSFTTEWKEEANCSGLSEDAPLACGFTPAEAGSYRLTASIKDTKSNSQSCRLDIWVAGKDYVLWDEPSDSHLQIVPEKTIYRVGDTARYLIKNPYPGAQALITIERYGVIDYFVKRLDGNTPVVEFPIQSDYLPGFYLSVLVVSPRVEKPPAMGQVDLGKPAFRLGYLSVPVKDSHKELQVTATADKEVYRPRETLRVSLHVEPKVPSGKTEATELAVTVLDEAVFDLLASGKSNFDPYEGFYKLDNLDLRNYSLLTRLVGRQKFEKKGANAGGDGGANLSLRHLFKFVSYWNPSIMPDKNGNATIEFQAPDNLTGWRVLAIASTATDKMGLGDTNFKVNRPTEVRPAMPNQVLEGDQFSASFSVMNRSDHKRTLDVSIDATGNIDSTKGSSKHDETLELEPYQRHTVVMPVAVSSVDPKDKRMQGEILFRVRAGDEVDTDGIVHTIPVRKLRTLETAANYASTDSNHAEEQVLFPTDIHTDRGGISVVVSPSVIAGIEGAFRYLKNYAYNCWEQILTKGTMAAHYNALSDYMAADFKWDESRTLPKKTLEAAANFQAPNGGMAFYIPMDQYADPYLSAYTALAFNWLRKAGYTVPQQIESKLHGYLLELLRRDIAPTFYSAGMSSTIRAVALAALAEHGKIKPEDLERYKSHLPQMSLFGKAHYLQALHALNGNGTAVREVVQLILAHANQTGGKFIFNEELDDSYSRILASPLRENCTILSALVALAKRADTRELVQDVPTKLMRTIAQARKNRDHWENTQENMFCMQALMDYSRSYETAKPNMSVQVAIDQEIFGKATFKNLQDKPKTFERAIRASDLGRKGSVAVTRQGSGRVYYATRLQYADLNSLEAEANAGIEIHREYSVMRDDEWKLLTNPYRISRGELVRVDIFLSLPAARHFVVVDDPVPGGLEPVNRELATASLVDAASGDYRAAGGSLWFKFNDWSEYAVSRWSFYHQELRHDAVRFYSDFLPAGNYHLSYTAQAIAEGNFYARSVHAVEMYDSDVLGRGAGGKLEVLAQP
ncbi:MAG: large extracellular alpha-helical protein, partial [Deltaproteobacteria bacterium]|nr:large extracellular alpha-helical protein [Deltaproteobacteria bacterium]